MRISIVALVSLSLVGVITGSVRAQERIPDILKRTGRNVVASGPAPSGFVDGDTSIQPLLAVTDVIVRGRLENQRSYLSDDQRRVATEYSIGDPEVLYRATLSKVDLPTAKTVTLHGGSVTIDGLTYTATNEALPMPEVGGEYLLLLRHYDNRYYLAGLFYGLLRISDGRLVPVSKDARYVEEFRDALASEGIADIVARRVRLGQ